MAGRVLALVLVGVREVQVQIHGVHHRAESAPEYVLLFLIEESQRAFLGFPGCHVGASEQFGTLRRDPHLKDPPVGGMRLAVDEPALKQVGDRRRHRLGGDAVTLGHGGCGECLGVHEPELSKRP